MAVGSLIPNRRMSCAAPERAEQTPFTRSKEKRPTPFLCCHPMMIGPPDCCRTGLRVEYPRPETQPGQNADDTAEALRVLYVAATRAKRLVALALPGRHIPLVAQHLLGLGVTIETS